VSENRTVDVLNCRKRPVGLTLASDLAISMIAVWITAAAGRAVAIFLLLGN